VFIALNWKALKAFLPDMSAAARMFVIAAHVARQPPLHELTHAVSLRQQNITNREQPLSRDI
jgi:hypothetical protein